MSARRGSPCRAGGAHSGGFAEARPARECVRGDAFSGGLTVRRGERPSRQSTCVALRGALRGAGARVEEGCQTPDVNAALCGSVSGEEARPFSLAGRTSPFPSRCERPWEEPASASSSACHRRPACTCASRRYLTRHGSLSTVEIDPVLCSSAEPAWDHRLDGLRDCALTAHPCSLLFLPLTRT